MPFLYILGRPNGVGKTSFYDYALSNQFISPELPFINVDTIARIELGGYSEENIIHATSIARSRIGALLDQRSDFMIESNLAAMRDYDWIQNMRKQDYKVVLYFLNTDSAEENIKRIERRILEGGHSVPPHIVKDRYRLVDVYLKARFHLFDETLIIDNSGETALVKARLLVNKIVHIEPYLPDWVTKLLSIVIKLNNRSD